MRRKYIYKGPTKIFLIGYGQIFPGMEIETDFDIKNDFFKKITKSSSKKKLKNKKEKDQNG